LSFDTVFTELSDEALAQAINAFGELAGKSGDYLTKYLTAQRESEVIGYMSNDAQYNAD
jgi:hypothetical protein